MGMFPYVRCMGCMGDVCTCTSVWRPEVNLCSFFRCRPPCFLRRSLSVGSETWQWGWAVWPESPGDPPVFLLRAGFMSVHHLARLFMWVLTLNLGPLSYLPSHACWRVPLGLKPPTHLCQFRAESAPDCAWPALNKSS